MRTINRVILALLIVIVTLNSVVYASNKKEDGSQYISKVNPVLVNVQLMSRNINQNLLTKEGVVKQMKDYIEQLRAIKPPVFMAKYHKMILLSFQKMEMGFYLLSKGDSPISIPLIKKGAELLRTATKNIVDLAKKEGFIKEKDKGLPASEKGSE